MPFPANVRFLHTYRKAQPRESILITLTFSSRFLSTWCAFTDCAKFRVHKLYQCHFVEQHILFNKHLRGFSYNRIT